MLGKGRGERVVNGVAPFLAQRSENGRQMLALDERVPVPVLDDAGDLLVPHVVVRRREHAACCGVHLGDENVQVIFGVALTPRFAMQDNNADVRVEAELVSYVVDDGEQLRNRHRLSGSDDQMPQRVRRPALDGEVAEVGEIGFTAAQDVNLGVLLASEDVVAASTQTFGRRDAEAFDDHGRGLLRSAFASAAMVFASG